LVFVRAIVRACANASHRCVLALLIFCFSFFQAEDGIPDFLVTGVQTCAFRSPSVGVRSERDVPFTSASPRMAFRGAGCTHGMPRSEERRVGKECRRLLRAVE